LAQGQHIEGHEKLVGQNAVLPFGYFCDLAGSAVQFSDSVPFSVLRPGQAKATKVPLIFNTIPNCVSVNNSRAKAEAAAAAAAATTMITNKIDNKSNAHMCMWRWRWRWAGGCKWVVLWVAS